MLYSWRMVPTPPAMLDFMRKKTAQLGSLLTSESEWFWLADDSTALNPLLTRTCMGGMGVYFDREILHHQWVFVCFWSISLLPGCLWEVALFATCPGHPSKGFERNELGAPFKPSAGLQTAIDAPARALKLHSSSSPFDPTALLQRTSLLDQELDPSPKKLYKSVWTELHLTALLGNRPTSTQVG